jgi:hypothetical protein
MFLFGCFKKKNTSRRPETSFLDSLKLLKASAKAKAEADANILIHKRMLYEKSKAFSHSAAGKAARVLAISACRRRNMDVGGYNSTQDVREGPPGSVDSMKYSVKSLDQPSKGSLDAPSWTECVDVFNTVSTTIF